MSISYGMRFFFTWNQHQTYQRLPISTQSNMDGRRWGRRYSHKIALVFGQSSNLTEQKSRLFWPKSYSKQNDTLRPMKNLRLNFQRHVSCRVGFEQKIPSRFLLCLGTSTLKTWNTFHSSSPATWCWISVLISTLPLYKKHIKFNFSIISTRFGVFCFCCLFIWNCCNRDVFQFRTFIIIIIICL